MRLFPTALGILFALGLAVFVFETYRMAQVKSALQEIAKERDVLNIKLKNLDRLSEQNRRDAAIAAAAQNRRQSEPVASEPAPARVEPKPTPGVSVTAPKGWAKNGSNTAAYVVGVDQNQTWGGMASAYVNSNGAAPHEFGGMMQTISAENFLGQRLRLSGWVKTEDANDGGGHLWLRIDGRQVGASLQFDNMDNRAVKGTSDWQECAIVLDVPSEASALAYGFFLKGGGKMWVNGTKIEPVGPEVSSTNMITARKNLPKTPVNLGFDPDSLE
jgi:hypothetical protein